MDKVSSDNVCPRCQLETLAIYYTEDSDLELGARCEECGYEGFYIKGKLVQLTTA
ncbi:MAG TPA: hypothetical protein VLV18_11000 [Terriglobales bacterium]|nr:hypothetical protein [Terriglobales bacterium]